MSIYKNNEKGSSLLEVLAVLSVVSVLGISTLKLISNGYNTFKQSMAESEIKDLQKSITGVYNYSGNYNELFDNDVYKTLCETDKSAPSQMCMKNGSSYKLRHKLSGDVFIEKAEDLNSYTIKFDNLSKKNCVSFAQLNWLDRKKISIYRLDINDTDVAYFPKKEDKGFPIEISEIFKNCNKEDNKNSITWYFY